MTAGVLKHDPNTKTFKNVQNVIYNYDTDTQYGNFAEVPFVKPQNDT